MKFACATCLVLTIATVCFAQAEPELCPRHIEAPIYPAIARTAHIQGTVPVRVTLEQDGSVSDAEVIDDNPAISLLWRSAVANAKTWTFSRPPHVPYTLTITYNYRFDKTLPVDYVGDREVTKIVFDLPARVSILANNRVSVGMNAHKRSTQAQ